MSKSNLALSVLNVVLAALSLVLLLAEIHFERTSPLGYSRHDEEIIGKSVEDLFVRTPVLPDCFVASSCGSSSQLCLFYDKEKSWLWTYPSRFLVISSNNVVFCQSWL
ncbi:MAG: hypothetical protein IJ173_01480 [Kiritimatiellae bacterium]|nr:hypothetical protein [Kiritimatiellia bacterium]